MPASYPAQPACTVLLLAILAYTWPTLTTCSQWEPQLGRATFYGHGDGFTLNDGSCACHKQWSWTSSACESSYCFDYIGSPRPAPGAGFVAAINTAGLQNTGQCGACYRITCANGPTRGLPDSSMPDTGCWSQNKSITVMITDSCPCKHANPSNQKWCCGDTTHFDLSIQAFSEIADINAGVVDVMYERLPYCQGSDLGVHSATCQSYWGFTDVSELWKLGVGLVVSLMAAGLFAGLFVAALYGRVRWREQS